LKDLGSKTGVNVNWTTALQAVTALACARVIGEGLAQIPLKLHKSRPDGGSDVAKDHPLYELIYAIPNDYITSYEWRETMGLHLVFAGNSYNLIVRVAGRIVEIIPLNPRSVTMKMRGLEPYYEVAKEGGGSYTVAAADMLHIKGISWDNSTGLDGIKLAKEVIGLSLAAEEHGARTFGNGAQPNGILTTDTDLKDEATRKLLRESWNDTHGGLKNTGKTALLWGGLKWMSTSSENDKAQFLETRVFQVSEVCRWARVLPIMVGHADKAMTFASSEQMFLAHVVHTMSPWYARIEQAFNKALLTKQERTEGYYFKFSVAALMRRSHKDRSDYFSKALGAGGSPAWMTQDEVRALDELNPMGGDASKLPIITNTPAAAPTSSEPVDSTDSAST
jgi:HK97 family phage portal protein